MAKKQQQPPKKASVSIGAFFGRFHAVIFFVAVCGALAVAVYMLSNIVINTSSPTDYTPPTTISTFDTDTIKRVNELRDLETPPTPIELPTGVRTDPFTE